MNPRKNEVSYELQIEVDKRHLLPESLKPFRTQAKYSIISEADQTLISNLINKESLFFGLLNSYGYSRRKVQRINRWLRSVGSPQHQLSVDKNHRLENLKDSLKLSCLIKDCTLPDGTMFVYHWGRDCDHCESDGVSTMPATKKAFEQAEADMYDNAEEPCTMYPITEAEAAEFRPTFRDHIMEAFEDGHPYSVAV